MFPMKEVTNRHVVPCSSLWAGVPTEKFLPLRASISCLLSKKQCYFSENHTESDICMHGGSGGIPVCLIVTDSRLGKSVKLAVDGSDFSSITGASSKKQAEKLDNTKAAVDSLSSKTSALDCGNESTVVKSVEAYDSSALAASTPIHVNIASTSVDDQLQPCESCVRMNSPVPIRENSMEAVSETDEEDVDLRLIRNQGNPLPGLWSFHYKPKHSFSQNSSKAQVSLPCLDLSLSVELSDNTELGDVSANSNFIDRIVDLTQDEGIVVDKSSDSEACDSGDDVTIVKVVEGRKGGVKGRSLLAARTDLAPVVSCCGIALTQADLDTLKPYQWLNDQIVNAYMKLLMKSYNSPSHHVPASPQCPSPVAHNRPWVHITSTFFYTKLSSSGYCGVERWLKNVDMRKLKLLLVPVHMHCHWCLAAVDFRSKCVAYYDSMGGRNITCLKRMKLFLISCGLMKKCRPVRHWRFCYPKGVPLQKNSSDCGVFMCHFARWLCTAKLRHLRSNSRIPFSQKHMPTFRSIMIEELKSQQLISL